MAGGAGFAYIRGAGWGGCRIIPARMVPANPLGEYVATGEGAGLLCRADHHWAKVAISQRAFLCTASHDITD